MSAICIELPKDALPPEGQRRLWRHDGRLLVLFNVDGVLYAIDDTCPHAGASLASGKLQGRMLQCPAHGLKFDLADGCMRMGTGQGMALTTYAVHGNADHASITFPVDPHA